MNRLTSLGLALAMSLIGATTVIAQNAPATAATAIATSTDPICFETIDQAADPARYRHQVKVCTQQIPGGEATSTMETESSSSTSPDGTSSESSYSAVTTSSSSSVTTG